MTSIDRTIKPKKGRPPVDTEPVNLRLSRATIEAVDDFRRQESDLPSRPEAIRRLLDIALKTNFSLGGSMSANIATGIPRLEDQALEEWRALIQGIIDRREAPKAEENLRKAMLELEKFLAAFDEKQTPTQAKRVASK